LVESLFGPGVCVAEAVPELVDDRLFPAEYEYIRRAAPRRRAEFGVARLCARRALAELGVGPVPIVPGPDRAPEWPPGVAGSISHTDGLCAAAVARVPAVRALGLDLEALRPVEPATIDRVLTAHERAWLERQPEVERQRLALMLFSAKEAFYKCQYAVTREFLDFREVEVDPDVEARTFEVRVVRPGWPADAARASGRFAFTDRLVACGVQW
jgi:4'-phosphopantetheinyl transferase EntD